MRRGRRVRSGTVCERDPRMSTLTVSATINYSLLILPDVTLIDFTNTSLRGFATASFASGDDVIAGRMGADKLLGGEGDDQFVYNGVLDGSVDEIIDGGGGKDIITGGNQGDLHVFNSIAESGVGAARDKITDFSIGNDIIDLSAIDAIAGGADDAFVFKGQSAFDGAGQVRFTLTGGGNTIVEADLDGNGVADFQILLTGLISLTADEFIL